MTWANIQVRQSGFCSAREPMPREQWLSTCGFEGSAARTRPGRSEYLPAQGRTASTLHSLLVGCHPVINREFGSGLDAVQRVNFDSSPEYSEVAVGRATMVEILERVPLRAVQGVSATQFNQVNLGRLDDGGSSVGQCDETPGNLAAFPTTRKAECRKQPATIDPANANLHGVNSSSSQRIATVQGWHRVR